MSESDKLTVAGSGDRDLVMTRVFDAPRAAIFDTLTKPELVKRWLLGPPGWTLPICDIDPRPGGRYRHDGGARPTGPRWEWAVCIARCPGRSGW
jgi:uncharacterized protein YndB with AHSA1/START domain